MIFSRIMLKDGINPVERVWSHVSTEDYALHQTVWDLLATNGGGRDFLFRTEKIRGNPVIYTVSHKRPFAPDNSPWYVDAKPYNPAIVNGERLIFSVRVSACKKRYEENGKLKKTDIVIAKKKKLRDERAPIEMPSNQEIAHMAASEWMKRQGEHNGFELIDFQVTQHEWHEFRKTNKAGTFDIAFSSLDLDGTLLVTSPEGFKKVLFQGIGSAKAFGCGLMLVRRV
ncbi:MAG: type I-E CRISPR-associated protein Cas6/Cse3/CasE [Desulfovibrionales bacterium]|nr:type I-E CRISPR-associated protein Cas6/Cse3/CasE [Desulfovibrionales bacterium]